MSGRSSSASARIVASEYRGDYQNTIDEATRKIISEHFPAREDRWDTEEQWLAKKEKKIAKWIKFINGDNWDTYRPDDFDRPRIILNIAVELVSKGLADQVEIWITSDWTDGYDTTSLEEVKYVAVKNDENQIVRYIQKPVTKLVLLQVDEDGNDIAIIE